MSQVVVDFLQRYDGQEKWRIDRVEVPCILDICSSRLQTTYDGTSYTSNGDMDVAISYHLY